jgi:hypothetical protein
MINVTLGEVKPQEKPFPKLMIATEGFWKDRICLFKSDCKGLLLGPKEFGYAANFYMEDFTDYNGPITLQNA